MQKETLWSCLQGSRGNRQGEVSAHTDVSLVTREDEFKGRSIKSLGAHPDELLICGSEFISLSVSRDLRHLILLFCAKCSNEAVFAADFHPTDTNIIVTCGKSHLYFWTLEGSSLIKKQGLFEVR